jgi:S-formylglutathione hydrolase FrmB
MRRLTRTCLALCLLAGTLMSSAPPAAGLSFAPFSMVDASFVSRALGGERERLRVFVPFVCTPWARCPVLYLLHGFGGDWKEWSDEGRIADFMMGPSPLPMVIVMPDGGGAGFWTDWFNEGAYGPPRYETMFLDELMPFVERTFPVRRGRAWTGIDGVSLGGFGSWKLALKHPDRFASVGSISGALNVLVAPGAPDTLGSTLPVPWTGDTLPRPPPPPAPDLPGFPFGNPFRVFGDPVTNEWYYRTNNPLDLASNGKGLAMRHLVFDAEPAAEPPSSGTFGDVGLEAAVLPMNLEMDGRLDDLGYEHEFQMERGNHSWASRTPFIRQQLEFHASHLTGRARPPATFTYRSAESTFAAYGWRFRVRRDVHDFVEVAGNARGLTLLGGGVVEVRTPRVYQPGRAYDVQLSNSDAIAVHRASREGTLRFRVDLGGSPPADHHDALGGLPGYYQLVEVRIS